jgi:FkbM family methyltransferase
MPPYLVRTPSGLFLITNEQETIQSHLLASGRFEPLASAFAAQIASVRPGLVVDVGANIGTFAIPLALQNPRTTVLAFEPQPGVFQQLCANVVLNRLRNVKPHRLAVGIAAGTIRVPDFDPYVERYTGSVTLDPDVAAIRAAIPGVAEPALTATEFEEVRVVSLSEFIGERAVAFLKIDVEGMELDVLKGAQAMIERSRPVIFSESWALAEFASHKAELMRHLRNADYTVREIGDDFMAAPAAEFPRIDGLLARVQI